MAQTQTSDRVAIFLHSGDFDRLHQGFSIASSAHALGRSVDLYFFWWALKWLDSGETENTARFNEIEERLESLGYPSLTDLIDHLRQSGGCTFYACTASIRAVGADADRVQRKVDHLVGWASILELTRTVTERYYL